MRKTVLVSTFSLLSAVASAAVAPKSAPALSQEQLDAARNERKVAQPRALAAPVTGPWSRVSRLDSAIAYDTFDVQQGTLDAAVESIPGIQLPSNQRQVALRINDGLDHLGPDVIVPLADEAGLDHLDLVSSKTLFTSEGDCNRYQLKLRDTYVELPFSSNSVSGDFHSGKELDSSFNLPGAEAHAELEWTITNTSSSGWCFFDPVPAMNIAASFTVGDLDGDLAVELETDGNAIAVDQIENISFAVDDFAWGTNSWFLNTVLSLGFSLYDLFDFSCSGQAECLSEAVNEYALEDDDFVDEMTALVNDAIDAPLTISSGTGSDGFGLGFSVSLSDLKSSTAENTLTSLWDVELSSTRLADACASTLFVKSFMAEGEPGNASLTSNDLELEVPYHLVSKAAYFAGKQGVFCQDFNYNIAGTAYSFSIVPNGSVGVSGGDAGDPANRVKLTLPVKVLSNSAGVTSTVAGTLTVKGSLGVDTGSDLVLSTLSASISALSGTLKAGAVNVSAANLSGAINTALARILSDMDDLELMNAVVNTGIAGTSVSIGQIETNGSAFVIGLNLN